MSFAWGKFSRKQLDVIANSTARLNILDGSVRSGKTVASLVAWIFYVQQAPPGELLMAGKTERTLKRNVLDPLEQMVGPRHYRLNKGTGELILLGRRVYLAGANDERAEGKIRGITLAGAYCDEASLHPESFFTMLLSRLSVPGARLFGTTNPDSPYHWLKVNYIDRVGELNLRHWHFTLDDNLNLDPAYVEALKKEYIGLWYKRFILGLWVLAEGAIYDMWDERVHVIDDSKLPQKPDMWLVGVDYGTSNPTVFLLCAMSGGTLYVVDEYYYDSRTMGRQKTDAEYSADMRKWLPLNLQPHSIEVDPSAASFIVQLRKDGFARVHEADNEVIPGIRRVAARLADKRLLVHERCKNLIREFGAYVWDPRAQKKGEDKPLKENDHALDALRYLCSRIDAGGGSIIGAMRREKAYGHS